MSLRYGMTTWAEIHAANKDLQVRVKELDELIECEQCDKKASGYTVCPSCWNELGARVKELEAENTLIKRVARLERESALQKIRDSKQVVIDELRKKCKRQQVKIRALNSKREGEDEG